MNEMHDPEICRSSRSGGGQTSFYVTSWDNRRSDAGFPPRSHLRVAKKKKMKKKKTRGQFGVAFDGD